MEERLQQLIQQRDALNLQISEINFLIKGYDDTIKAQEEESKKDDNEKEADQESAGNAE